MEKILRAFEKSRAKPESQSKRDAVEESRLPDLEDDKPDEIVSLTKADKEEAPDTRLFSKEAFAREERRTPSTSLDPPRKNPDRLEWEDDWNRPRAELPEFLEDEDDAGEEPPLELDERDEVSDTQIRDPFDVSRRVEELLGAARVDMDEAGNVERPPALHDEHQEPHFDHLPDRPKQDHGDPDAPRPDSGLRITAISAHDPFSPVTEEEEEGFGWTVFFTVLAIVAVAGMLGIFYLAQSHPDAAALLEGVGRMIAGFAAKVSEWWNAMNGA